MNAAKKRHRLTKRGKSPIDYRLILLQRKYFRCRGELHKAKEQIEVQRLVIEKLERQIHEEPRW